MQLSTYQKNEEPEEDEIHDKTVSMIESIIGPPQRLMQTEYQKISYLNQKQSYQQINDHNNSQYLEPKKFNYVYNQELVQYQQPSKQQQDSNVFYQNNSDEIDADQFQNQSVFSKSSHKNLSYQPNNQYMNQFQNVQYIPQQFPLQEMGYYGQNSSFYQNQPEQPFQNQPNYAVNYNYNQQQRAIWMNNESQQLNNQNLSLEQIKMRENQELIQQKYMNYQNMMQQQKKQVQSQYYNQGRSGAEYYQQNQNQFGNPHYDEQLSQYGNSESPVHTQERIQALHNQTYQQKGLKQQFGSAEATQRNNLSSMNLKYYPGSSQVSQMSQGSPSFQNNYKQQERNVYYLKKSDQEFEQNSFSSFTESKLIQNRNNISSSDMGTINQNQPSNFGKEQFSSDIEPNQSVIDDNFTDQSSDIKNAIQNVEIQVQSSHAEDYKKSCNSIGIDNLGQLAANQQFNGAKRPRIASGKDENNKQQQLQVVCQVRGSGSAKAKYGNNYEKDSNYQQNSFYLIEGINQPYNQDVGKIIPNQDFRRKISSQTFIKNQKDKDYNESGNRQIDNQNKSQKVEDNKLKKGNQLTGMSNFPIDSTNVNSDHAHSSFGTEKETTSTMTLGYDEFIRQVEEKLKEAGGDPEEEFRVLDGKILKLAQRKRGSILLQNHLKAADQTLINKLLNQLLEGKLPELMMSKYGNYYSQQLIDYLQVHQRLQLLKTITGAKFVEISCNDPGTHVLQTILLHATQEEEFNIVRQTLVQSNNIVHMATDKKGHHVLKVILTQFPPEFKDIIFENLCQNFDILAKDQNGLCVVKEVIKETRKDSEKQEHMVSILLTGQKLLDYCQHEYGNFVVSEIIKNYSQNQWIRIIQKLRGYYVRFSQNQYASQLIEICIAKSPFEAQEFIIDEFVKSNQLHKVIQSKNGNYVIQKCFKEFIKDIGLQLKLLQATVENLDNITDKKIRQKWGAELLVTYIQQIFQKLSNNQEDKFLAYQEYKDRLLSIDKSLNYKMFSTQKLAQNKKQQHQLPQNRTIYSSQGSSNTFQDIYKSDNNKKVKANYKYSDHNSTKDDDAFYMKDSQQVLSPQIQPNSMFAVSNRTYNSKLTQPTSNQAFSELPEQKAQRQIHITKTVPMKNQSVGIESVGSEQKLLKQEEFSEGPKNKKAGKKNRKITRIKQSNIVFAQKQEEVLVCSSGGTTNRSNEQNAS